MFQRTIFLLGTAMIAMAPFSEPRAEDAIKVNIKRTEEYDSNLFRLADDANTQERLGRSRASEIIGITNAELSFDKTYSLNRFVLAANLVDYSYRSFDYLNFTALNYSAAWYWSLTPRLTGTFSSMRQERPTSYQDFRGFNSRNIHIDLITKANMQADIGGPWRLLGGFEQRSGIEEQQIVQEGDRRLSQGMIGARYMLTSGSSASIRQKHGSGDSIGVDELGRIRPIQFSENISEAEVNWRISAKTNASARLGHVSRSYEAASYRDFSGPIADIQLTWDATEKSSIIVAYIREVNAYANVDSSYIRTNRISISPHWKATPTLDVRMKYEHANRTYGGSIADRNDTMNLASLGIEWHPLRAATISASARTLRNSSNLNGASYKSNGALISAQIGF